MKLFISLAFLTVSASASATPKADAAALFERYQALERAFDPEIASLYCNEGVITVHRPYSDGRIQTLTLTSAKYTDLLRAGLPIAKQRGDRNTYSNVNYRVDGNSVEITAERYAQLRAYTSPYSLRVGRCSDGRTGILAETAESRPGR